MSSRARRTHVLVALFSVVLAPAVVRAAEPLIVSVGGVEFMRVLAERVYGIWWAGQVFANP